MEWKDYIDSNQEILSGKPIIKGTRISVEFLIDLFAKGWTKEQVLDNYTNLTNEALDAVFKFVLEMIKDESLFFLKRNAA